MLIVFRVKLNVDAYRGERWEVSEGLDFKVWKLIFYG